MPQPTQRPALGPRVPAGRGIVGGCPLFILVVFALVVDLGLPVGGGRVSFNRLKLSRKVCGRQVGTRTTCAGVEVDPLRMRTAAHAGDKG